jgi:HEAT repeat protein
MMSMRRPLACVAILVALSVSAFAQDLTRTFNEGVDLLKRGDNAEALRKFQECLAMDPGSDAAYELFQNTEHQIWLDLLGEGGDYERVAARLMDLARVGRMERRNDEEAIRGLVAGLKSEDVLARMGVVRTLSADHGEYAVPQLLYALSDPDDDDRRVIHMLALTKMGGDVVLPLVAALDSSDAFLRRNVCHTLGYLGDPRSGAFLAGVAASDSDEGVRNAAAEAAAKCGASGNAVAGLLRLGTLWAASDPSVLMPHQVSEVTWSWDGTRLVPTEVPKSLYNEELAKRAFYAALRLNPASNEALAGVAGAVTSEQGDLEARAGRGDDVAEWQQRLAADELSVQVAGPKALDLALMWALETKSDVAASGLCRALGASASAPTAGLEKALGTRTSGAVRGEAAVALGQIAHHTGRAASPAVVSALGEAAAREVLQLVAIIDGDAARSKQLYDAIAARGISVHAWGTGARGLVSLRQVPGVDAVLIAESLPDLTFAQVADEVRDHPGLAETPIFVLAADPEAAAELWSEKANGALVDASGVDAVVEAMAGGMNRDREEANRLAGQAAQTLMELASAGHTNLGDATQTLAGTLAGRPDSVTVPAMGALAAAGGVGQVPELTALLGDSARSDAARQAAAGALAGIFARSPQGADESTLKVLDDVARSDAAFPVRRAAAIALGRLDLAPGVRAGLVEGVRANVAQ